MRCGSNTSRRLGFLLEFSQCLLGLNEESLEIQGGNARTSEPPLWNRFEFKIMRHLWWFRWDVDDTLWVMHFNAGFCWYPRWRKETQDGTRLLCVHFWRKSRPFLKQAYHRYITNRLRLPTVVPRQRGKVLSITARKGGTWQMKGADKFMPQHITPLTWSVAFTLFYTRESSSKFDTSLQLIRKTYRSS